MRRIAALLTTLLLAFWFGQERSLAEPRLDETAVAVLRDYELTVEGRPDSEYVLARDNFVSMRNAGKIAIKILDEPCESLLRAMEFQVNWETGRAFLAVNKAALLMYQENKSVVYSMITHELWHAYAYAQDPAGFKDYNTDPFEKMMYQSDAYHVEGKFITEVLLPKGFTVSRFEQYLSDCYKAASIDSFTIVFSAEDVSIARTLYEIREKRLRGAIMQDELYMQAATLGRSTLSNFKKLPNESSQFETYARWIGLITFDRYVKILVNQTEKTRSNWDQVAHDFPDFMSIVFEIQEMVKDKGTELTPFMKQLVGAMDIPVR